MTNCFYEGRVRHERVSPHPHLFSYSLFMVFLDLSDLEAAFRRRWLWSTKGPNIAWFRREDHLGNPEDSLSECVKDFVEDETGDRPTGPIRLLTHLRYFGFVMNPVSFYYCYDKSGEFVENVVAEINNTPWGERHCYVVSRGHEDAADARLHSAFRKDFHVSPFMSLDQEYSWIFTQPGETATVHMENWEAGRQIFSADLTLRKRDISGWSAAAMLVKHPLMTVRVIAAIYWQAFKLWRKRTPYYPHPSALTAKS
ncbi:MAG: DUF1365 domain-containing protein [Planctomycetota bacterium]